MKHPNHYIMEWISVKNKLPENGKDVLVVNKIHESKSIIAFDYMVDNYFFRCYNVTHWMPLPNLPES